MRVTTHRRRGGAEARVRPGLDTAGFTLVEVTISAVVGVVVLLAVYQALFVSQRAFTIQSEQVRQRQTLRATLDVMHAHLARLSGPGSDIVAGGSDSIRFRAMLGFGIVCQGAGSRLRIEAIGRAVDVGDSVLVFAENGIADGLDDAWLAGVIGARDTATHCPSGTDAYDVEIPGITLGAAVRVGAPLRSFRHETLRLAQAEGAWFLARSHPVGPEPLVGPLSSPMDGGLQIQYVDSLGISVAEPAVADQIVVTVRTESQVLDINRTPLSDSARIRISLKN